MATDGDIARRMLRLKEQVQEEKTRRSELKGELKRILAQLQDEFDLNSIQAAEKVIASLEEDIAEYSRLMDNKINEAEEAFT